MINLEDCGVDPVGRGIALGFDRIAKGSDAKIIDVRICFHISDIYIVFLYLDDVKNGSLLIIITQYILIYKRQFSKYFSIFAG